jgi:hypothetical protein
MRYGRGRILAVCLVNSSLLVLCTPAATAGVIQLAPSVEQNGQNGTLGSGFRTAVGLEAHKSGYLISSRYLFALSFDLSSLSGNAVQAASLQVTQTVYDGSGQGTISIYGVAGPGTIPADHFSKLPAASNLITSQALVSQTSALAGYDLTSALQNAVASSWDHLLLTITFSGGKFTYNRLGYKIGFDATELEWNGNGSLPEPTLFITIPEPSTLMLAIPCVIGLFCLAMLSRSRSRLLPLDPDASAIE